MDSGTTLALLIRPFGLTLELDTEGVGADWKGRPATRSVSGVVADKMLQVEL